MEVLAALDHVRRKLEDSFGKAMAMMILAAASNSTNVSTVSMSGDEFRLLIEEVCKDDRVRAMWGAAGADDAALQWKSLT